ncbi:MAG: hypothetical protein AABY13_01660, partial [Nanoarchaeota archaeon]
MASPQLLAYIQSLLRNGYREDQVRAYLLRGGYTAYDIEDAFRQLHQQTVLSASTAGPPPWLWIAGAVLGLSIGGILVAFFFAAPTAQLTLRAAPAQVEVRAGDSVTINDVVTSSGTVTVTHTLKDQTGNPVAFPVQQLLPGKGKQERSVPLDIPQKLPPGTYVMEVSAVDAKGKEATTTFSISVLAAKASCSDGIQNQAETGVDCGGQCASCPEVVSPGVPPTQPTGPITTAPPIAECPGGCNDYDFNTDDACIENQCVHTDKPAICGNGICNAGETSVTCPQDCGAGPSGPNADQVVEEARTVAPDDADRAVALCGSLPKATDRDGCFSVVASSAGKSDLCAQIVEDITRDQCLIDFALSKNEFDVCERIGNRYLRGSCNSLRNLRQLEQQRAVDEILRVHPLAQLR